MASSSETSRGAKRRTVVNGSTTRNRANAGLENGTGGEDGCDSGLSSESSTPTNGSPPPRQPKTPSNGQVVVAGAASAAALRAKNNSSRIGSDRMSRLFRSRSGTESPRSLDNMRNRQVSSPMRSSGNVTSNWLQISSPCVDSGDEASLRIDRGTYQYMFQDIVSIKTMLLKLKRILQETETLNPFDNAKNGLFCNLNEGGTGTIDVSTSPGSGGSSIADELADLRRQVVFLQGQVEDRDRTIQLLELQMSKLQGPKNGDVQNCILPTRNISSVDTCNAATQTEKTRPVSAGPSLLQSLPQDGVMGPLVSWSDSSDRQRPSLLSELNSAGSPRKPIERLPHTLRLRQEQAPARRGNAHTRRHSSESVTGSPRSKDCAKPPCDSNDMEQRDAKIEGNTVKSLIPTPRKLRL
ncbi:hypothetical protein X777_03391 [Ooceraea biroi]|uniref:Uncharacterized protein n=1 Tax=Ooceraea biroi TaxID=2015173 RepID=A0A026X239_OOCBI|nr:hypothetical protein X777_03391 [Ooceraea biroi]